MAKEECSQTRKAGGGEDYSQAWEGLGWEVALRHIATRNPRGRGVACKGVQRSYRAYKRV